MPSGSGLPGAQLRMSPSSEPPSAVGAGVLPRRPVHIFVLVVGIVDAGRAAEGAVGEEPGLGSGAHTHGAGGSSFRGSRGRTPGRSTGGAGAWWPPGPSPAERGRGYPQAPLVLVLDLSPQRVAARSRQDGKSGAKTASGRDPAQWGCRWRQEGAVANAGEGLGLGLGAPGLARLCLPAEAGARRPPSGTCRRGSTCPLLSAEGSLLRQPCLLPRQPAAAGRAAREPGHPDDHLPPPGDRALWGGCGLPVGPRSRHPPPGALCPAWAHCALSPLSSLGPGPPPLGEQPRPGLPTLGPGAARPDLLAWRLPAWPRGPPAGLPGWSEATQRRQAQGTAPEMSGDPRASAQAWPSAPGL